MPKIQVITEEMLGKAKNINQGAMDIFNSQGNVTKTIQNLGKDFSGRLPSLIVQNVLSMRDKYKAMNETLDQYGKFLENAANTYEWNERELTKWATALGGEKGASVHGAIGGTPGGTGTGSEGGRTGSSNLISQDMNSRYYNLPAGAVGVFDKYRVNEYDHKQHMDCAYYAHARAMEVNQMDTWTPGSTGSEIRANSIAQCPGHRVYIEDVYSGENGELRVKFSESNWGYTTDPNYEDMSYSEFVSKRGAPSYYMYF